MAKTEQRENRFLIQQARIMEERRLQDEQRKAEAEKKTVQVGEAEAPQNSRIFDPNAPTIAIESANPFTGEVHTRTVDVSRPAPQRIVKPALLSLSEIKESLIEAGNQIDAASAKYAEDNASLDAFYSEQHAVKAEIAELQAKLNEKQARLSSLESEGTPKDKFAASIVALERDVAGLAGGALLDTLSEQASQKIFGIPFSELSKDSQRDVQARYRKALQKFSSNYYMRLGRDHKRATSDQVEQRSNQMLDDLDNLLLQEFFSEAK